MVSAYKEGNQQFNQDGVKKAHFVIQTKHEIIKMLYRFRFWDFLINNKLQPLNLHRQELFQVAQSLCLCAAIKRCCKLDIVQLKSNLVYSI